MAKTSNSQKLHMYCAMKMQSWHYWEESCGDALSHPHFACFVLQRRLLAFLSEVLALRWNVDPPPAPLGWCADCMAQKGSEAGAAGGHRNCTGSPRTSPATSTVSRQVGLLPSHWKPQSEVTGAGQGVHSCVLELPRAQEMAFYNWLFLKQLVLGLIL